MNKNIKITLLVLMSHIHSCSGQVKEKSEKKMQTVHDYTNSLIHESSPYLLQHAHNPVNWYPWGEEALQKAERENKLLIISVGYAACHWCHVMEHESFEDTLVAELMNKYFVSIKVDREERPDVDQVYMNAAQLITGQGGWPLNALALPNGKPFFAGTYFPKTEWVRVLDYFATVHQNNPEKLQEQAEKVTQGIQISETVSFRDEKPAFLIQDMNNTFHQWKNNIDFIKGGGNRAPKFPMPSVWEYLLHLSYLSDNREALKAVTATLDHMAFGGIYDHVGGGFARYSTDVNWHVPHFEIMLYDNAQLVSLYSHAWQQTKNPLYKRVVLETLEFIERELTSPEGGFFSSLDADSDGEEGKFYVWTMDEITETLGADAILFSDYYNITKQGNWEQGKNILFRKISDDDFAESHHMKVETLTGIIDRCNAALLKEREQRTRPGLDDKILTSWNALMLRGYVHAYRSFGDEAHLNSALKNAQFLLKHAITANGGIMRNHKAGKSSIHGFLDDYVFVISAFIELYQATFDEQWLNKAEQLTDYTIEHFFDSSTGMFFYTHNNHSNLIVRKMEVSDNVIPASNSEMAKNLIFLGHYLYQDAYLEKAQQMLINVQKEAHQSLYFYSNWAIAEAHLARSPFEVAIVGKDFEKMRRSIDHYYLPDVLMLGGDQKSAMELLKDKFVEGQTTIYVCRDKSCKKPVTVVSEALDQLSVEK